MINGLDLFSGIGGLTIALSPWVKPIAYCENERYAIGVLLSRMSQGDIPRAPIWDDVRTLSGSIFAGMVDIIYGGFPCQDVSQAGARAGLDGIRTGLFREAIRLIRECKPQFVFLENVPGIRKYVPTIRKELEAIGYDCGDGFLSAAEVGANHIRNRWWLLAYASGERRQQDASGSPGNESKDEGRAKKENNQPSSVDQDVSDAYGINWWPEFKFKGSEGKRSREQFARRSWWVTEPNLGRVVDGVSFRVDRLKGLGNAVFPLQAREAFKILMGLA